MFGDQTIDLGTPAEFAELYKLLTHGRQAYINGMICKFHYNFLKTVRIQPCE